ncbi:MAG: hypothetical protein WD226_02080 [Planctomycetota bacterium]
MQAQSVQSRRPEGASRVADTSGLSGRGWLLLILIGATLFAVTILRIDRFVLAENQRDAPATARILVAALGEGEIDGSAAVPPRRLRQLLLDERFVRQLPDHRWLDDGHVLLRFGYLFQLVDGAPLVDGEAVLCWPWRVGRTGRRAFLCPPEGETFAHSNAAGWSGLESRPALDRSGWSRID